jgi:hypothetical protein
MCQSSTSIATPYDLERRLSSEVKNFLQRTKESVARSSDTNIHTLFDQKAGRTERADEKQINDLPRMHPANQEKNNESYLCANLCPNF